MLGPPLDGNERLDYAEKLGHYHRHRHDSIEGGIVKVVAPNTLDEALELCVLPMMNGALLLASSVSPCPCMQIHGSLHA